MDARRLFAFSTWRIARVERPFVMINSTGGRTILTFTLRDLARGCPLGRDRIDPKADGRRWDSLCAAVGSLEPTPQGLLELTDAEVDVALDPASRLPHLSCGAGTGGDTGGGSPAKGWLGWSHGLIGCRGGSGHAQLRWMRGLRKQT